MSMHKVEKVENVCLCDLCLTEHCSGKWWAICF